MQKTILLSSTVLISTTLLMAVAVPSLVLRPISLPIGVAHAQAQINSPPSGAPGQGQLASITNGWWKWIFSIDTTRQSNPFSTFFTGDCGILSQPGRLMFLVGTSNAGPGVQDHGTCNVPAGTSILFPLLNSECDFRNTPGATVQTMSFGQPFKQLRSCTDLSAATSLAASLDGAPLQYARVQSSPGGFMLNIVPNNPFAELPGPSHSVADGYWVLLPSLSPGQHTVSFGGCFPPANFCTGTIVYHLIVR